MMELISLNLSQMTNGQLIGLVQKTVTKFIILGGEEFFTHSEHNTARKLMISKLSAAETIYAPIQKLLLTENSKALDKIRDQRYVAFDEGARGYLTSPEAAEVQAAKELVIILDSVKGLARLSYDEQTTEMHNLKRKLEVPANQTRIDMLGLKKLEMYMWVSQGNFEQHRMNQDLVKKGKEIGKMEDARTELEIAYRDFCDLTRLLWKMQQIAKSTSPVMRETMEMVNIDRKIYGDMQSIRTGRILAAAASKEAQKLIEEEDALLAALEAETKR